MLSDLSIRFLTSAGSIGLVDSTVFFIWGAILVWVFYFQLIAMTGGTE